MKLDALAGAVEPRYVLLAADQPRHPLPALVYANGCVLTEWQLTEPERASIAAGENLRLWLWTSGHPFPAILLEVTDGDHQ